MEGRGGVERVKSAGEEYRLAGSQVGGQEPIGGVAGAAVSSIITVALKPRRML